MNLHRLMYSRLPTAGIVVALLLSAWISIPLVLGNSSTSKDEAGWPYMPIAFIGGMTLVWFAAWNSGIVFAGTFARRFGWLGRSALLLLTLVGAFVLFYLLTMGWLWATSSVLHWARLNSSELWNSAAWNSRHAFDTVAFYSWVSGAFLLAATQLLPNPSLERTRTGMALGPRGSQG